MMTQKAVWTLVVLAGAATNLRTLSHAVRRRRLVRASGRNGQLRVLAAQGVRGELTTLFVQGVFAALVAAAWSLEEPALAEARGFYAASGWSFAACSLALGYGSLQDLRDRRRLFRLMAATDEGT